MGLAIDLRMKTPDVGPIATGLNMKSGQSNTIGQL